MFVRSLRLAAAIGVLVTTPLLDAQFGASRQMTDGAGGYGAPRSIRSASDVIAFATERDGTIYTTNTGSSSGVAQSQLPSPFPQRELDLTAGAVWTQYLAYTLEDGSGGVGERDIRVANNGGGPFGNPEVITDDDFDDRDPVVIVSASGDRHVVWVSDEVPGSPIVRWKRNASVIDAVGIGESPRLCRSGPASVLITYLRGGVIQAREASAGGLGAEFPLLDVPGGVSLWSIVGDNAGAIHVVTVEGGGLVHRSGSAAGGLGAPLAVDPGPVDGTPRIAIDPLGRPVLVWSSAGEILWSREDAGAFPPAAVIPTVGPGSTDPSLSLDSLGYLHVSYLNAGEVWYLNDVPAPTAAFTIAGAAGELPVTAEFTNTSQGVITDVLWDFGDGTTSVIFSPMHTYTEPGGFDVTLTVVGPGGEDTITDFGAIVTSPPSNVVELADIIAFGGQPVIQPILATHPDPLQGFQTTLVYDEAVTPITGIDFTGTEVESLAPEFVVFNNFPAGENSELIIAVIFDTLPPFDGRVLSPGVEQTLGNLLYNVPFGLTLGTVGELRLVNGIGDPPISNSFAIEGGFSVAPYLLDGSCTVSAQPQFLFVRGDVNYNQSVDIADAIFMLGFLFSGGATPVCPDSADANDDGALNIGDAIYILGFLFSSGPTLPYPFPGLGIDPTEDTLGVCSPSPVNP